MFADDHQMCSLLQAGPQTFQQLTKTLLEKKAGADIKQLSINFSTLKSPK